MEFCVQVRIDLENNTCTYLENIFFVRSHLPLVCSIFPKCLRLVFVVSVCVSSVTTSASSSMTATTASQLAPITTCEVLY